MSKGLLRISDLRVSVDRNIVLEDLNLELDTAKVNVLFGPNGAGKSTFANVLMGNPKYKVESGKIFFNDVDITSMETEERAKMGMFLSFQHPVEVEGVSMLSFLKNSYSLLTGKNLSVHDFNELLDSKMSELGLDKKFKSRFLNHNFSGGEKKKSEILQLILTEPKFAVLDEIDSGLDVDAIRVVGEVLSKVNKELGVGFLIITHSSKILEYFDIEKVCVLDSKKIVKEGGDELLCVVEGLGFSS